MMMLTTNAVCLLLLIQCVTLVFARDQPYVPTCLTQEFTLEKFEKMADNMSLPFLAIEVYAPWQPNAKTLCHLHDELSTYPGLGLPTGLVNCAKEEKLCSKFPLIKFPCFFLGGLKMEPNGDIRRNWIPYFGMREIHELMYVFRRQYPDFSVPVDMDVINRFSNDETDQHPKVLMFNNADSKLTLSQRVTFEFFGKLTFYHAIRFEPKHQAIFDRFQPTSIPSVLILKKSSQLPPGAFDITPFTGAFDHASLAAFLDLIVSEIPRQVIPPAEKSEEVPARKGSEKV